MEPGRYAHLQVLRQEGVARILLHPALEGDGSLLPLHTVGEVHNHGVPLGHVPALAGVRRHIYLRSAVRVLKSSFISENISGPDVRKETQGSEMGF